MAARTKPSPPPSAPRGSADVVEAFRAFDKRVVTFVGNSGSGYEEHERVLERVAKALEAYDPSTTVINIGATADGIGAAYALAKIRGFTTTGIVSILARQYDATISPYVDHVFFVQDDAWGGYLRDSTRLSPSSEAMVAVSDVIIGIGGGAIARDEMLEARSRGKRVIFWPADMSHDIAVRKAARKGTARPTDFRGAAHAVFGSGGDCSDHE